MTFFNDPSIKLQLDIMYLMNPQIASIRFASNKDEIDRKELNDLFGDYPHSSIVNHEQITRIKNEWEYAKEKRKPLVIPKSSEQIFNVENALVALRHLIHHKIIDEQQGIALYFYLKQDHNSRRRYIIVKIISLYFECYDQSEAKEK